MEGRRALSFKSLPAVTGTPRSSTPTSVPDVPSTAIARTRARSTAEARRVILSPSQPSQNAQPRGPERGVLRDMMTVAKGGRHSRRGEGEPPRGLIDRRRPHPRGADIDAQYEIAHDAL